jgi:hypothetical protein
VKLGKSNFLEYLGAEEQNLLTSIINFKGELDLFYNVDRIYQEPLGRMVVGSGGVAVPQLYLFVHFHLYFSISCLLRCHLSDSLSSLRKAIDASLCGYKIIVSPDSERRYWERDKYFQFIKANFQNEMNKDQSAYPLARSLIKIHELCSEFGSHSDISSFIHRLETKESECDEGDILLVHYFQFPRNPEEFRYYYISILQSFYLMFLIFKTFLDQNLRIVDPKWESTINHLGPMLDKLLKESYAKFGANS